MRLPDRGLAAGQGDDGGVTGLGELDTLEAQRADAGGALLQHHGCAAALRENVENGAANADGGERRRDLVGGLFRMARDKAEGAGGEPDRDVAIAVLIVEDGAIELDGGAGADR